MKKLLIFLLISVGAVSCGKDSVEIPNDPVPMPTESPAPTLPEPSPSPSPDPEPVVDYSGPESLRPYIVDFVKHAKEQGVDVSGEMVSPKLVVQIASLDHLGYGVIGLCETGGIRRVTLDPDFWDVVSETQKMLLMHHELGHCVLMRPHNSQIGVIPDESGHSHELSIMYPIIFGDLQYSTHEEYYQKELFQVLASEPTSSIHICK